MTRKLYLDDSYLFEFQAEIVTAVKTAAGWELVLDKTAFYPDSGGQLCDHGSINGASIGQVVENDGGEVRHLVTEGEFEPGQTVTGTIDRRRRLDNMRKHTGQHILSRAFIAVANADTLSSRLGETEATIELSVESLTDSVLDDVERMANEIITADHPVQISYHTRQELALMPIRKIPERDGNYRIIQIDEFDYTACGGTHCRRTGEVGLVKIVGQERLRGHLRVIFLTGQQARGDYRDKHRVITQLSGRLTCHFQDLTRAVEKLFEQNTALRRENSALLLQYLEIDLKAKAAQAEEISGTRLVPGEYDNYDPKILKDAAVRFCETTPAVAIITCGDKILIAVSPGRKVTAGSLARLFMEQFEGKGGGSAVFAQVGGVPLEKKTLYLSEFLTRIKDELGAQ